MKQLTKEPKNFIIAVVRNPDAATELKPYLGTSVVVVKGDTSAVDSFPVRPLSQQVQYTSLTYNHFRFNPGSCQGDRDRQRWQGRHPS